MEEQPKPQEQPQQPQQPPQQPRMRRVLIGTPSYDGKTDVWYNDSMNTTIKIGMANGVDICPIYLSSDAMVQRARNDLIQMFLQSDFDDFVFIDADQAWDPRWVFSLISRPQDVVGGVVVKKNDVPGFNVKLLNLDPKIEIDGLMEVEYIGTGFLKISRKAAQAVYDMSEPYTNSEKSNRMTFDIKIVNGELVSEDNIFCDKWRGLGGKVWIDPHMTCSHVGAKRWDGNFLAFLQWLKEEREKEAALRKEEEGEQAKVVIEPEAPKKARRAPVKKAPTKKPPKKVVS